MQVWYSYGLLLDCMSVTNRIEEPIGGNLFLRCFIILINKIIKHTEVMLSSNCLESCLPFAIYGAGLYICPFELGTSSWLQRKMSENFLTEWYYSNGADCMSLTFSSLVVFKKKYIYISIFLYNVYVQLWYVNRCKEEKINWMCSAQMSIGLCWLCFFMKKRQ